MNKAMEVVEKLRKKKRVSKEDLIVVGSRSKYYAQMEAADIKVMDFRRYLNLLGYDLVIKEKEIMPFEMRF